MRRILSSQMWYRMVWYKFTDISEERTVTYRGDACVKSEALTAVTAKTGYDVV
jgi:hypothetical protein